MDITRRVAVRMAGMGLIEVTQKGQVRMLCLGPADASRHLADCMFVENSLIANSSYLLLHSIPSACISTLQVVDAAAARGPIRLRLKQSNTATEHADGANTGSSSQRHTHRMGQLSSIPYPVWAA